MIGIIADALASTGFSLLKNIVNSATSTGVNKVEQFVEEKTGLKIKDAETTNMSVEDMEAIKKCVIEYETTLSQIALERDKLSVADLSNARQMQIDTLKNSNGSWFTANFVHMLAVLVITIPQLIIAYGLFFAGPLGPEQQRVLEHFEQSSNQLMNIVIIFYFGSTFKQIPSRFFGKDK